MVGSELVFLSYDNIMLNAPTQFELSDRQHPTSRNVETGDSGRKNLQDDVKRTK